MRRNAAGAVTYKSADSRGFSQDGQGWTHWGDSWIDCSRTLYSRLWDSGWWFADSFRSAYIPAMAAGVKPKTLFPWPKYDPKGNWAFVTAWYYTPHAHHAQKKKTMIATPIFVCNLLIFMLFSFELLSNSMPLPTAWGSRGRRFKSSHPDQIIV